MVEHLIKQQIYTYAEREFKKMTEEKKKVTQKMAYDIMKKFFPNEYLSRLHQLVNEADKDGINEIILENFMVIINFLINEEKQPDEDDDFADDEEIDQRNKDFIDKIWDLVEKDQSLTPTMLKQLFKDFKIKKHKD